MDNVNKPELSPELKDKFKLAPGAGVGEYVFKGERINLATATLEKAERMVAKGFPFLVKVDTKSDVKKNEADKVEPVK